MFYCTHAEIRHSLLSCKLNFRSWFLPRNQHIEVQCFILGNSLQLPDSNPPARCVLLSGAFEWRNITLQTDILTHIWHRIDFWHSWIHSWFRSHAIQLTHLRRTLCGSYYSEHTSTLPSDCAGELNPTVLKVPSELESGEADPYVLI